METYTREYTYLFFPNDIGIINNHLNSKERL